MRHCSSSNYDECAACHARLDAAYLGDGPAEREPRNYWDLDQSDILAELAARASRGDLDASYDLDDLDGVPRGMWQRHSAMASGTTTSHNLPRSGSSQAAEVEVQGVVQRVPPPPLVPLLPPAAAQTRVLPTPPSASQTPMAPPSTRTPTRAPSAQTPLAPTKGPTHHSFCLTLWKLTTSISLGLGLGDMITNWNADVGAIHPSVAILRPGIAQDAGLMVGDVILQVNGGPARGHLATTSQLQQAEGPVELLVRRKMHPPCLERTNRL